MTMSWQAKQLNEKKNSFAYLIFIQVHNYVKHVSDILCMILFFFFICFECVFLIVLLFVFFYRFKIGWTFRKLCNCQIAGNNSYNMCCGCTHQVFFDGKHKRLRRTQILFVLPPNRTSLVCVFKFFVSVSYSEIIITKIQEQIIFSANT
jgi:hypothetical protein